MSAPYRKAVLVVFAYRLAAGLVVGYPMARAFGALGATSLPDGDLELFAPRGFRLMETLRLGARPLVAAVESGLLASVVVGVGAVVPLVFALSALAAPDADARSTASRTADRLSASLLVSGLGLVLKAALVALLSGFGFAAGLAAFGSFHDERVPDLGGVLFAAPGLVLVTGVGLATDLALAILARLGGAALGALSRAVSLLRSRPGAVLRAFTENVVGASLLVVSAAWLTGAIDVSRPGGLRIFAVVLVHQTAVFGVVALRMRYFGALVALVPEPPGESADPGDLSGRASGVPG
ncbi:MAG TPA: hypothetical protein VHE30_26700 [Polyangiaceae bacterium]|nr:hypothetical protein [Polyangiaceae bacterium]